MTIFDDIFPELAQDLLADLFGHTITLSVDNKTFNPDTNQYDSAADTSTNFTGAGPFEYDVHAIGSPAGGGEVFEAGDMYFIFAQKDFDDADPAFVLDKKKHTISYANAAGTTINHRIISIREYKSGTKGALTEVHVRR